VVIAAEAPLFWLEAWSTGTTRPDMTGWATLESPQDQFQRYQTLPLTLQVIVSTYYMKDTRLSLK